VPSLKPEVLEALAGHGLRPRPDTPLEKLRDQVRDLYLIEIRQLRDRCRAGEFPVRELSARVIELRKKYPILSIRLDQWELP
jgi:hypothetical protein